MTKEEMDKASGAAQDEIANRDSAMGRDQGDWIQPMPMQPHANTDKRNGIVPRSGTPITRCPTNIDSSTQRGKALLLKAGSPGELTMGESGVLKIVATNFVIFPDWQQDETTGEVKEFARVALFNAAGQHYRTTAAHAPFRIAAMMELYTPEEWAHGIPLVVSAKMGKRQRVYHDIQIDLDALEA